MSEHNVKRIAARFTEMFQGKIDMSDCASRTKEQQQDVFLSRSLAAYCIRHFAAVGNTVAAGAVVDGFGDEGIDAIYFDRLNDSLILVQSKWVKSGTGSIDSSSVASFVEGAKTLLSAAIDSDMDAFNDKIRQKEPEIFAALKDTRTQLLLVTACTGNKNLSPHARGKIDAFLAPMNDVDPMARHETIILADVFRNLASEVHRAIDLDVYLHNWGKLSTPYLAYYGYMHSDQLAQWWHEHGGLLCHRNLRHYMRRTLVNEAIRDTLEQHPEEFWYLNNGITIICEEAKAALAGASDNQLGVFKLKNASIVNGAQTIGVVGASIAGDCIDDDTFGHGRGSTGAWVHVRIISLHGMPDNFDKKITRATNFQNAVEPKDFAALDPVQQKLAADFSFDRRQYTFKSGDPDPKGNDGCNITEATQALACANSDITIVMQAKREIGRIWLDEEGMYKKLFNPSITAKKVWNAVCILRAVDQQLERMKEAGQGRRMLIAVHLRLLVVHVVFQDPRLQVGDMEVSASKMAMMAAANADPVVSQMKGYLDKYHANEYPASLSKSTSKCAALVSNVKWRFGTHTVEGAEDGLLPFST